MSSRTDKIELERKPGSAGRFDKAFPVFLEGERGVASGIGRNISDGGMFIETREPFPLGTRVKVTREVETAIREMARSEGRLRRSLGSSRCRGPRCTPC